MGQSGVAGAPYPISAAAPKGPLPQSVRRAVLYMRIGGALTLANGVLVVALTVQGVSSQIADTSGATSADPAYRSGFVAGYVAGFVLWYLAAAGLWLWMAQANKAGRRWARVTGTVFFGVYCLLALINMAVDGFASGGAAGRLMLVALVCTAVTWAFGLFAVILLWSRKSAAHFAPPPAPFVPNPQSKTTMDALPQQRSATDPWSTPSSQA